MCESQPFKLTFLYLSIPSKTIYIGRGYMKHRLTVRHSVRAVVSDLYISYGEILEGLTLNINIAYDHRV